MPLTLTDGRESFTFTDWAYLCIGKDKVEILGNIRSAKLAVKGNPKLLLNAKNQKASISNGYLSFSK